MFHSSAIISPLAIIHKDVEIGPFSIIHDNETFARNTAKQLIINRTHPVK